jgi:hypothetical protein
MSNLVLVDSFTEKLGIKIREVRSGTPELRQLNVSPPDYFLLSAFPFLPLHATRSFAYSTGVNQ